MAGLSEILEGHHPARSISLPSRLKPKSHKIETELKKLKAWEFASSLAGTESSLQAETVQVGLAGLAELYTYIQELINSTLTQQALLHHQHGKEAQEALDRSIGLLDICGSARDLFLLMKEHVQELLSALRRKGGDSSIKNYVYAYIFFRKKAKKEIFKSLKALKKIDSSIGPYQLLDVDHHQLMVVKVLRELSKVTVSMFQSLLLFMSMPVLKKNTSRWSLISKLMITRSDREEKIINEVGSIDAALCSLHERIGKTNANG
ncbi:DUF241 domain protein [Quillaja saponaria]|uniref:DUF241 domain protein n=1 Tax=Quillaja saponaria TaxID=32244 RepID=A0AAD7L9E7_QUISA|nr:DUF241 domain protein [Quillaja saponaria]